MQRETDAPEQGLALQQREVLALGQEAVCDQVVQGLGVEVALGHPADHLNIAQASGVLLDVGLQVVGRIAVFVPARLLLLGLGGKECLAGPDAVRAGGGAHAFEQGRGAAEKACSMRLVMTVTSARASLTHSSTVRTLCPPPCRCPRGR